MSLGCLPGAHGGKEPEAEPHGPPSRDTGSPQRASDNEHTRSSAQQGSGGYRTAVQRLQAAQKSAKGAPAYSLYINRPLGRRFAAVAYVVGLNPNQVTAISAVFSYAGIVLIATLEPSIPVALVVTFLLVIGYALDAADGQLARLRGGGSVSGEWLDHIIDAGKISALHLAVTIAMVRHLDWHPAWLLVPLGFAVVANVSFFGQILNEQLARVEYLRAGQAKPPTGEGSQLRSLAKILTDYGLLCLIFLLFGWPEVFFVAYTILAVASAGYLLLACLKWYQDMRGLDRLRANGSAVTG